MEFLIAITVFGYIMGQFVSQEGYTMFINYRLKAKRQMAIFATLGFAGFALCVMSGLAMATIPHQDFAFWAMLGVGFVGFFTLFWSILGFIFGLLDYKSLSQGITMDFDLNQIEKEMEMMTQEMTAEEIAEMEQAVKDSFEFGKTFEDIFGA